MVTKSLFITPQGLSRLIKNLETELDTTLFLRSKSGEFLHKKAAHMIKEFQEIQTGIKKLEHKKERLMIACSYGVMSALSVELLFDFMADDLQVESVKAIPFADTDFSWDIYFLYNKNAMLTSAGKQFESYIITRI